jgi:hypothetical protein
VKERVIFIENLFWVWKKTFAAGNKIVARSRKKKKKTIKFELTLGGLLGVGAVLFCIFLWMFLIGIWAGQTILLPAG